jgi:hypothetical protein
MKKPTYSLWVPTNHQPVLPFLASHRCLCSSYPQLHAYLQLTLNGSPTLLESQPTAHTYDFSIPFSHICKVGPFQEHLVTFLLFLTVSPWFKDFQWEEKAWLPSSLISLHNPAFSASHLLRLLVASY